MEERSSLYYGDAWLKAYFQGVKRRFGEYLFSVKEVFRRVEVWLRTYSGMY